MVKKDIRTVVTGLIYFILLTPCEMDSLFEKVKLLGVNAMNAFSDRLCEAVN
jgi:hypothetical protein